MSWSLDPLRPDPTTHPDEWYNFWEKELEWCYSRLDWERLHLDKDASSYTPQLSESNSFDRLERRRGIADAR